VTVQLENDILDDLEDLLLQATKERSHFYVASCITRAIEEIKRLRSETEPDGER
jgi:hypothetical protein